MAKTKNRDEFEEFEDLNYHKKSKAQEETKSKDNTKKTSKNSTQKSEKKEEVKTKKTPNPSSFGNQIMIVVLVAIALFIAICLAFNTNDNNVGGVVGNIITTFVPKLLGVSALALPFLLLFQALKWKKDTQNGKRLLRFLFIIFLTLFISIVTHLFYLKANGEEASILSNLSVNISKIWNYRDNSISIYSTGGVLGAVFAILLFNLLGIVGSLIFSIVALIVSLIFFIGLTPSNIWQHFTFYVKRAAQNRNTKNEKVKEEVKTTDIVIKNDKKETTENVVINTPVANETKKEASKARQKGKIDADILEGNGITETDDNKPVTKEEEEDFFKSFSTIKKKEEKEEDDDEYIFKKDNQAFEDTFTNQIPVIENSSIRTDPNHEDTVETEIVNETESLDIPEFISPKEKEKKSKTPIIPVVEEVIEEEEEEKDEYIFPPIDLLQKPKMSSDNGLGDADATGEILIETLKTFRVEAEIVGISKGPTVTMYEIALASGTRVRTIYNLIDDISLAIGNNGVRIEGVIPGKSAIGIEVPNKKSTSVFIRELIENPSFSNLDGKLLTGVLGKSVTGENVYIDIAKMPHLLVAGTTGSGKSVCISSMIISMLYRARPDEIKFVLIDPKKVEFNVFNGLPHLLVPVVSDPKKAAGALHWCVTEMERRFDIFEQLNVKNLESYNQVANGNSNYEKIPQVVIAIDELADLMMQAADDVETSICRIAQKARAAGMHLIIGTQRPSVDVITGLIKANVPSRIALAVKSQIDSRTMLDEAGAEKLLGKGDMLYAPLGANKPKRIQGTWISEEEVASVVDFIKNHSTNVEYSSDVVNQIEQEAKNIGNKKGKAQNDGASVGSPAPMADGEKSDPMFESAVLLAIESGKISTSLIQRKLSLGFGRAAKLIDMMEAQGIVSAPDGQKPRNVLLTREEWSERCMRRDDSDEGEEE